LIGEEPELPYQRPPLSKRFLQENIALELLRPDSFYATRDIQVLTGRRVDHIDRKNKTLLLGDDSLPYDKLILAIGSRHRVPALPGLEGNPHVFFLRTAAEARRIRASIPGASRAVLIGGGYIGLEVAASLRQAGLEVNLLEMEDRVLSRVTSPEVSAWFEALHQEQGVTIHNRVRVTSLVNTENGVDVRTDSLGTLSADLVIMGTGALANSRIAEEAGLEISNGIQVNKSNQTSDPDILAIGDCCTQWHALYQRALRLESVQNALDQAKQAARALCGKSPAPAPVPWFWSDQYKTKLQIAGLSQGYDRLVIRESSLQQKSAWYFKRGRLLSVDAFNDPKSYVVASRLLREQRSPRPEDVANPDIELKSLLHT
jgi:3-phenylpropionate/trans-cinnamate dioxygenase ferredoxin reductase subunit